MPVYDEKTTAIIAETKTKVAERLKREPQLSKSAQIRMYYDAGVPKGEIARIMNIKYQFVRNVLISSGYSW